MSAMPQTLKDVFDDIVAARGGPDAFSAAQLVAARGLARVLGMLNDGDTSKASSIETLERMLPPLPKQAEVGPTALTVTFVRPAPDQLNAIHQRDMDALRREYEERLRVAQATQTPASQYNAPASLKTAINGTLEAGKIVPFRDGMVHDAFFDAPPAGGDPRGNGSCAISMPLHERYPLAHLDPVGKW